MNTTVMTVMNVMLFQGIIQQTNAQEKNNNATFGRKWFTGVCVCVCDGYIINNSHAYLPHLVETFQPKHVGKAFTEDP